MGTTLTGLTPATTYDSLIKVTDNGPLGGSLKTLTDGLGNDSALALSTGAASVTGTLAVSSNLTVDTNTLFVDATNNRVGVGTSSPAGNLHIASASDTGIRIQGSASGLSYIDLADTASGTPAGSIAYNHIVDALIFATGGSNTERLRITSSGNVGIGTSSPVYKLQVSGASPAVSIDRTSGDQPKLAFNSVGTEYASIISNASSGENRFNIGPSGGWGGFHTFYTDTTEKVRIANNGNVGIGTSAPSTRLQVVGGGQTTSIANAATTSTSRFDVANPSISLGIGYVGTDIPMLQSFNNGTNGATNLTINPFGGSVGIGTTSPAYKLEVNGNAYCTDLSLPAAGGIYFDSGASKYLDDYEIGTWTMGLTFDGSSTGMTTFYNTGTYTKVGRQVTVNGFFGLTNKGSSTGGALITGLPFTVANSNAYYSPATLRFYNITYTGTLQAFAVKNTTTIQIDDVTESGVVSSITNSDFANDSDIMISLTYFV